VSLPENWAEHPLVEVIDFQEGPGILAKDFRPAGISLIRLSGLERGASVLDGCNFLDPSMVERRWSHFPVQEGDVLLSASACLGRIAVVDSQSAGGIPYTGIIRMRPRVASLDRAFLRYLLESTHFQRQVEAMGAGSVLRHFGPMHLRAMTVILPPLSEQRAITHILGALDDKVELNRRTNETLEAIAQAVFKSWFVDFDPVRAKMAGRQPFGMDAATAALFPDSFEDSPLWAIPARWEVGTIGALGEVICGKTPPTAEPRNYGGDTPFITIPDMHGRVFVTHTATTLSEAGTQTQPKKWLPALAVCVSCIATPGLSVLTSVPSHTNQQINAIVCRRGVSPFWCLLQVRSMRGEIVTGGAGGSATLNLNKGNFAAMPVLIPTEKCMGAFHVSVKPVFDHILLNEFQSQSLGSIRDTLMPKLLSGQVRVKDAEKLIGDAV